MGTRKGILLAAGHGDKLYPATAGLDRHLIPVWDRPLLYYPLTSLMLAGVRDVLVITTEAEQSAFERLLGHGARWGMRFSYEVQHGAFGVAHGLTLAADWLDGSPCVLALGDNVFAGEPWPSLLQHAAQLPHGALGFAARVDNPQAYGVVKLDSKGRPIELQEKPNRPTSPWAVTGLYFLDETAPERAASLTPDAAGQLRITDLNNLYLQDGALRIAPLQQAVRWWDCGQLSTLQHCATALQAAESDSGRKLIGPEEAALRTGAISHQQWQKLLERMPAGRYRHALELLDFAQFSGSTSQTMPSASRRTA